MAEDKKDQSVDEEVTREELDEKQALDSTENLKPVDEKPMEIKKPSRLKAFFSTKKGKIITILFLLAIVAAVVFGVPSTRYAVMGSFVKKDVSVSVIDAATQKPVSNAIVKIAGQSNKTSAKGEVTFKSVPVGEYTIAIAKKYYKDSSSDYIVPILSDPKQIKTNLQATGRQVEVRVTNVITKAALPKASIVVGGTSAITDDKGIAVVVLPADKKALSATVSLVGYNDKKVNILVTEQAGKNTVTLTPEGKLFYLSNQTGTVNVMKTDLDGNHQEVVLRGTGNEVGASLIATDDRRYLALTANRTGSKENQIYLIDTRTNTLRLIDGEDIYLGTIGWSGHTLVYQTFDYGKEVWQANRQSFKSYNADTSKTVVLEKNYSDGGDMYNSLSSQLSAGYLVDGKLIYGISWLVGSNNYSDIYHSDKQTAILSINVDGTSKKRLKAIHQVAYSSVDMRRIRPNELIVRITTDKSSPTFYSYKDDVVAGVSSNDAKFYNGPYLNYLPSPSGKSLIWQERRNGGNTIFSGDDKGLNSVVLAEQSEYSVFGWFDDDYILLSKGNNELYITVAGKSFKDVTPVKVTSYY